MKERLNLWLKRLEEFDEKCKVEQGSDESIGKIWSWIKSRSITVKIALVIVGLSFFHLFLFVYSGIFSILPGVRFEGVIGIGVVGDSLAVISVILLIYSLIQTAIELRLSRLEMEGSRIAAQEANKQRAEHEVLSNVHFLADKIVKDDTGNEIVSENVILATYANLVHLRENSLEVLVRITREQRHSLLGFFSQYVINEIKKDLNDLDFSKKNLEKADLEGVNFIRSNLSGASLWNSKLTNANFVRANLSEAKLWGAGLVGAKFWAANLSEADFSGANMEEADFMSANMENADLEGAILIGSRFFKNTLKGANFVRADLSRARLWRADLSGIKFRRANLEDADLSYSDLRGADFDMANINGVDFKGADLRGALNLPLEKFPYVTSLYKTKFNEKVMEKLRKRVTQSLFNKPHDVVEE